MSTKPLPILICCGIFRREIEKLLIEKKLEVKTYFLDASLHVVYVELEKEIIASLEKTKDLSQRGIVVIYGDMCHPRIKKIVKQYSNVVKVDALNCIDCLLGGHKKLLEEDPKCSHFYLSPGWMPSNLKKNKHFKEIFDWNLNGIKEQFEHLTGLIILDSLDNLDYYKRDIEEFSYHTGLQVKSIKTVGVNGLKAVIDEAINKLQKNTKK